MDRRVRLHELQGVLVVTTRRHSGRPRTLGRPSVGVLSIVTLIALTGCSGGNDDVADGPYAERIRNAIAESTSDFEREVLEDGVVTRAEYEEAIRLFTTCTEDAGYSVDLIDQGGYYAYSQTSVPGATEAFDSCAQGTTFHIEGIYYSSVANPDNRDWDEITLECLKREGLAPSTLTITQYLEALTKAGSSGVSADLPFSLDDPIYDSCVANPTLGTGAS